MRVGTRAISTALAVCAFVFIASVAYAADPPYIPLDRANADCDPCHYTNSHTDPSWGPAVNGNDEFFKYGPHGYYLNTTNRCVYCHTMHAAEAIVLFQPSVAQTYTSFGTTARGSNAVDTISELCFACHDNTGKSGVYSQLASLGYGVGAEHSVELTNTVPGSNLGQMHLSCTDCHTPHNRTDVAGQWLSFSPNARGLITGGDEEQTNRMLRDDIGGKPKRTYTNYGGGWCAACHDRRHSSAPAVQNHPTTETAYSAYTGAPNGRNEAELGIFIFDPLPANAYETAGMGTNGRMTPRPGAPRCQQCHENSMNVEGDYWGNSDPSDTLGGNIANGTRLVDGVVVGDSFPHQTTGANLLVETGDDLCLNCHATSGLP